jgi:hypothetical protein
VVAENVAVPGTDIVALPKVQIGTPPLSVAEAMTGALKGSFEVVTDWLVPQNCPKPAETPSTTSSLPVLPRRLPWASPLLPVVTLVQEAEMVVVHTGGDAYAAIGVVTMANANMASAATARAREPHEGPPIVARRANMADFLPPARLRGEPRQVQRFRQWVAR